MAKGKVQTPAWILEGFDSPADYEKSRGAKKDEPEEGVSEPSRLQGAKAKGIKKEKKKTGKTFKIRECPKCGSDDVGLVLSGSDSEQGGGDSWECNKCKWVGPDVDEKELTEDELMVYLDNKGEDVA